MYMRAVVIRSNNAIALSSLLISLYKADTSNIYRLANIAVSIWKD